MTNTETFIAARDCLLRCRNDPSRGSREFRWPRSENFTWARDYFAVIARDNHKPALKISATGGVEQVLSFAELVRRSSQVANFLAAQGIGAGDRRADRLRRGAPDWIAPRPSMAGALRARAARGPKSLQAILSNQRLRFSELRE
jgi:acetyl-CoA synthetase